MTKAADGTLDELHNALRDLLLAGRIGRDAYSKGIIALACEYAARGDLEQARSLVAECSESYLRSILPQQMQADEDFRLVASELAKELRPGVRAQPDADEALFLACVKAADA